MSKQIKIEEFPINIVTKYQFEYSDNKKYKNIKGLVIVSQTNSDVSVNVEVTKPENIILNKDTEQFIINHYIKTNY